MFTAEWSKTQIPESFKKNPLMFHWAKIRLLNHLYSDKKTFSTSFYTHGHIKMETHVKQKLRQYLSFSLKHEPRLDCRQQTPATLLQTHSGN